MASNGVQQQSYQPQQANQHPEGQQQNRQHHCKECGLNLNSAESLDVHLQYHKENLLNKWALQAAAAQAEESNNNTKQNSNMKQREFIQNSVTPSESSDNSLLKKSPEYGNRATPDTSISFGHPPTPQSYHSASSPYQNQPENNFSPGFQNYQTIKQERSSPNSQFQTQPQQQQAYPYSEGQYYNVESPTMQTNQNYQQDYLVQKMVGNNYRYDPYTRVPPYERKGPNQVSSSPAFPAQPTPSPSPKQCDKCGFVCESAQQLIDHINLNHPPTPAPQHAGYQQSHFMFGNEMKEEAQSDILDLDSHKVHHVYQEEEKRQNGEMNGHNSNPHSVTTMLSSWHQPQQKMYADQRMYMPDQKMYGNGLPPSMPDNKLFQHQPQVHPSEFLTNSVSNSHDNGGTMTQQLPYRPFENLPSAAAPVMPGNQVPNAPVVTNPPTSQKSANWKSNEARRPKTYNCTACNKWFTSSGHLKRHYNTTLHKNAVKSSGQPDPATLPISAHHHPARESSQSREDQNTSSAGEESRGEDSLPPNFDRPVPTGGLLQQPPNGPYDRQPAPNINMHHPPNIHHPPLHSPMGQHANPGLVSNMPGHGSPPNVEAGPSATSNMDTRGLLTFNTTPNTNPHGFNMSPMMPMDNSGQFQMYPNELAPHVMQTMVTSSPNTTGDQIFEDLNEENDVNKQPLPSFAQIQSGQRFAAISFDDANVGGLGPVTDSQFAYNNITANDNLSNQEHFIFLNNHQEYHQLTVMTATDPLEITAQDSPASHSDIHLSPNISSDYLSTAAPIGEKLIQYVMINGDLANDAAVATTNFQQSPTRPEEARIKREEPPLTSPSITSTVSTQKHVCHQCQKPFAKSCYLTQHNKTFHSGAKPYKCGKCGKRYSCEKTHKAHQIKHSGDKPYKCQECPKQFNHKTDLRRHMCVHTGHKPFTCDTCGKGFIRKDHMLKHKETHTKRSSKNLSYRCR